jgi:predicted DNA-binding transcriptional regulator AlpA
MKADHSLLNAKDAAKELSLSPSTLAKMRIYGGGPKYLKLGRRVVYAPQDLAAWLDANRKASTSDAKR